MNKNILLAALIFTCAAATPAVAQEQLTGMFRMTHTPLEVVGEELAQALSDSIDQDDYPKARKFLAIASYTSKRSRNQNLIKRTEELRNNLMQDRRP